MSFAGIESDWFHTVRSWPLTVSRLSSMDFSSPVSRASLSCMAHIARIDPTSARCTPRSAWRFRRWVWSSVNFIGISFRGLRIGIQQDVAGRGSGGRFHFQHAGPAGGICGAHQFRQAVAVTGTARDDEFAGAGDLDQSVVRQIRSRTVETRKESKGLYRHAHTKERILGCIIHAPRSPKQIADYTGLERAHVKVVIGRLRKDGKVIRDNHTYLCAPTAVPWHLQNIPEDAGEDIEAEVMTPASRSGGPGCPVCRISTIHHRDGRRTRRRRNPAAPGSSASRRRIRRVYPDRLRRLPGSGAGAGRGTQVFIGSRRWETHALFVGRAEKGGEGEAPGSAPMAA